MARNFWEQERNEVLEGVLDALRMPEPDADRAAVCLTLLRHLRSAPGGFSGMLRGAAQITTHN
jgi:hypothetical protein